MYSFGVRIAGSFDDLILRVTQALQAEGFGVLTEIDVKAVMKKKLDLEMLPYKILGACNPVLASRALEADPDIGALLPCNVVVREDEDGSNIVVFMDPAAVLTLVEHEGVRELAAQVREKLERVRDAIAA